MPPLAAVRVAGQSYRQPAGQETRSSLRQPAGLDPPAPDPDPDPDPDPPAPAPATSTSHQHQPPAPASWSRSAKLIQIQIQIRQPAGQDPPPAGHIFCAGAPAYRVKKRQPDTKNHQFFIMASGFANVS